MTIDEPTCPDCALAMHRHRDGDLDAWSCPVGHGLAATLSEAFEQAQPDELDMLWAAGATAAEGPRACPVCARAMVVVTVPFDSDEVPEGHPDDGRAEGEAELDLCRSDQLIWFEVGELDALPADRPDAPPSPAEEAALAQIRAEFGADLVAAAADRRNGLDRVVHRLMRNPRLLDRLDRRDVVA